MNFVDEWKNRDGNEKSESQRFWLSLIRDVLHADENLVEFEHSINVNGKQFFIDALIDGTRVLVENKSRKVIKNNDMSSVLSVFTQANTYRSALAFKNLQLPDWIVLCNFEKFFVFDMRLGIDFTDVENFSQIREIQLIDLPDRIDELKFLVDREEAERRHREDISVACGKVLRDVRDMFQEENLSAVEFESLNLLCERIVFCLYAEDSGIFPAESFRNYVQSMEKTQSGLKEGFSILFSTLDSKMESRHRDIDRMLKKFPYVDGELFTGEHLEIFDRDSVSISPWLVADKLSQIIKKFSWKKISPPIFGSIFEKILAEESSKKLSARRSGGIHFTSEKNIHKLIDPLFMDQLKAEFLKCDSIEKFRALHDKISKLKFFDPACGSGNFLTETYISLRRLENEILDQTHDKIKVSIENFYGIEINDFAVQVAKLALWISEHQMNHSDNFLPLTRNANIIQGNALKIDWHDIVRNPDYIIGNPPYVGYSLQTAEQKSDMRSIFDGYRAAGKMDYVCAWFKKAADFIRGTDIEVAFVSTNSICQGEHVGFLWKNLFEAGIKINFAWRSFKWDNGLDDPNLFAHVHCVIVGYSMKDRSEKIIYDEDEKLAAKNINGYLLDAVNISLDRIDDPICDVPKMLFGNMPRDGGNLIIENDKLDEFLKSDPRSKKFIHPYIGAEEFINKKDRWCLWLVNAEPSEIKSIKPIYERVKACKEFRLSSKAESTKRAANTAWLFVQIAQPTSGNFILVPRVSSERREYIPIGFFDFETIVSDAVLFIPGGDLWLFGILNSSVHMAWMKTVAGRLETRYRYSAEVVYNNFPFPKPSTKIETTAQQILDARLHYPNSSLADLYNEDLMPADLRRAHVENDRAVLEAYGFEKDLTESEIVARLFEMYQGMIREDN